MADFPTTARLSRITMLLAGISLLLAACDQAPYLERVKTIGVLKVATRMAPGIYYPGADGPEGVEFELVSRFADDLGIERIEFIVPRDLNALIDLTRRGEVHMAAANLTVTGNRRAEVDFSTPYHTVKEQLIYRRGSRRPRSLSEVPPGTLRVLAGSGHEDRLRALRKESFPSLQWQSVTGTTSSELLEALNRGDVRFTLADSNEFALQERYFRFLKKAFDVGPAQDIAWAFPKGAGGALRSRADEFLDRVKTDGTLELMLERYYGHSRKLNFVDKRSFWRDVTDRLPKFRAFFQEAAAATGIDWRLLAAIGYQESHWRPDAVSPTGVRGIMMLTRGTAKQMKIADRRDPRASIVGGARYLRRLEEKLPDRIQEPDKLWLTLAAYNVGFGHLEDARVLTERQGADPDLWKDVKQRLPLLGDKAYYRTLKHGRARGEEPVQYVDNIRNYYDLLVWSDNRNVSSKDR